MSERPSSAPVRGDDGSARLSRRVSAVCAAWLLTLGFDLFLHAGLLARLYVERTPFLLQPEEAFRRIPLGYLSFLVLVLALYWFLDRLGVRGPVRGFRHGALAGAVLWGAFAAGLYSISTARPRLLVGWWVGQALELGFAGSVLGTEKSGAPMKKVWVTVVAFVVACVAGVVALQSLGLAPAAKVVG